MKKSEGKDCITDIVYNPNKIKPLIANFQNGFLNDINKSNLESNIYKQDDNVIGKLTGQKIEYVGEVEKDDLFNHFIVVRNRRTRAVKLINVDKVLLKPQPLGKRKSSELSMMNASTLRDVSKKFGSKRAKRQTEQLERLGLNLQNVKDDLERTVADIEVEETELVVPKETGDSDYKPPINRDASTVEDVYALNSLVPSDVLKALKNQAATLLKAKEADINIVNFVKLEFLRLQNSPESDKQSKCQLLLYIDYLVKILVGSYKTISLKKFDPCPVSKLVSQHILDNFTQLSATGRVRPNSMKEKTLCYILVLWMIVMNYKIDLEDLSKELKFGIKKLHEICRTLGFSQMTTKDKTLMVLKLPLPAPVTFSMSKKKKR